MRARADRDGRSDEGSALILVMVLMVVGALIVLPLMEYAMSVGRANSILSVKTARTEAVKGGLRLALADSTRLYDTCGPPLGGANTAIHISSYGIDVPVETNCYFIDQALSLDATEVRYGLAAVQVGQTVPVGMMSSGYVSPNPTSTSAWIADTSLTTVTDKIWLPNLPTHGLSPRTPLGWQMPPEFLPEGVAECTVYFPGTYPNPVTLDGPTYFASGIYYFEDTVLISGGADVVVGSGGGDDEGCTQRSARRLLRHRRALHAQHQRPRGVRSCSASPAVSWSTTPSAGRSSCSSTSATWRPATPAAARRRACPSCP